MAKFLVWTDLHDEFHQSLPDLPSAVGDLDAILLAGDVSTQGRHIDAMVSLWERSGVPVRMVYGNHEFYGSTIEDLKARDALRVDSLRSSGIDVAILDRTSEIIAGTRILGCTLWTDLDLYPELGDLQKKRVSSFLNDFNLIKVLDTSVAGGKRGFSESDWLGLHQKDQSWLFDRLSEEVPEPTLVMTHHMPCRDLIHPGREIGGPERNPVNAGFASDLWDDVAKTRLDAWIFGHSHDNQSSLKEGDFGPVRFIANARGYPGERRAQGSPDFDPDMTVELPDAGYGKDMAP